MGRRRFDHLVLELSLAAERNISRYRLWLRLHAAGCDPEQLTLPAAVAFCEEPLEEFLAEEGLGLSGRALRSLRRSVRRYDPSVLTPYERVAQF